MFRLRELGFYRASAIIVSMSFGYMGTRIAEWGIVSLRGGQFPLASAEILAGGLCLAAGFKDAANAMLRSPEDELKPSSRRPLFKRFKRSEPDHSA
jgi:hypothetical protein